MVFRYVEISSHLTIDFTDISLFSIFRNMRNSYRQINTGEKRELFYLEEHASIYFFLFHSIIDKPHRAQHTNRENNRLNVQYKDLERLLNSLIFFNVLRFH